MIKEELKQSRNELLDNFYKKCDYDKEARRLLSRVNDILGFIGYTAKTNNLFYNDLAIYNKENNKICSTPHIIFNDSSFHFDFTSRHGDRYQVAIRKSDIDETMECACLSCYGDYNLSLYYYDNKKEYSSIKFNTYMFGLGNDYNKAELEVSKNSFRASLTNVDDNKKERGISVLFDECPYVKMIENNKEWGLLKKLFIDENSILSSNSYKEYTDTIEIKDKSDITAKQIDVLTHPRNKELIKYVVDECKDSCEAIVLKMLSECTIYDEIMDMEYFGNPYTNAFIERAINEHCNIYKDNLKEKMKAKI